MAYGDFKSLPRRTVLDKEYKEFNIPENPKHDKYQRELTSMAYDLKKIYFFYNY